MFTLFSAALLLGMFGICGLPIILITRQVGKWQHPEKELEKIKRDEIDYRKEARKRRKKR